MGNIRTPSDVSRYLCTFPYYLLSDVEYFHISFLSVSPPDHLFIIPFIISCYFILHLLSCLTSRHIPDLKFSNICQCMGWVLVCRGVGEPAIGDVGKWIGSGCMN